MNINKHIKEQAALCESEENQKLQTESCYMKDLKYFEGENKFVNDIGTNLKKIGVEKDSKRMYAISGQSLYWLVQNLNDAFNSEISPMERGEALREVRDIFGEDLKSHNKYWEEVEETEAHRNEREYQDGASEFYKNHPNYD